MVGIAAPSARSGALVGVLRRHLELKLDRFCVVLIRLVSVLFGEFVIPVRRSVPSSIRMSFGQTQVLLYVFGRLATKRGNGTVTSFGA